MSKIMKMPNPKRYESEEEEEEDWDEEEEEDWEEEEEEEVDEFADEFKEKIIENFDPNTVTVKLQKVEYGPNHLKFMKIDKEIELGWLMIRYCEHMGIDHRNTKFMFNGACVRTTDTPLKLSMVDGDIIFVGRRSYSQGIDQHSPICYQTLCIRAHKKRDTFVRVTRHEPLLRSIKRNFTDSGNGKHDSTCFFYQGQKLLDLHTMNMLRIEDGGIIDAFNFDGNRSSLSFVSGLPSTLRQPPTFKGHPDINKGGPRKSVPGTPVTRSRPKETQLRSNPPVQQQMKPPVFRYDAGPAYPGMKRVPYSCHKRD